MELYEYRCKVCGTTVPCSSPGAVETARSDHHRRVHLRAAEPVIMPGEDGPDFLDGLLGRPWLLVVIALVVLYLLGIRG
ncbi:hypothetical protein ACGF0D_43045 [Kitasatospora sp. NPDC048298]|uniref:hypothetical protein n=1 Tax=Kitasatospora sp. NPDC048298 TaxID=3364049 RepID=UPI00371C1C0F